MFMFILSFYLYFMAVKSSSANPLVRYCHFGISLVNYSDSVSISGSSGIDIVRNELSHRVRESINLCYIAALDTRSLETPKPKTKTP